MSLDLERLILNCDRGDLDAWRELTRLLKRKNMSGVFASTITSQFQALDNRQYQEKRDQAIEKALSGLTDRFKLVAAYNSKCFHLVGDDVGRRPICGVPNQGMWTSSWLTQNPLCKLCLKALKSKYPGRYTDEIEGFNDKFFG